MKKIFTCIICPNGCEIEVELDKDKIVNIEGATCKKGKEYVNQELTNPKRNISSSVKFKLYNLAKSLCVSPVI